MTVDVMQRFNVCPEICAAVLYQLYTKAATHFEVNTTSCTTVSQGYTDGAPDIKVCTGLGVESYFYTAVVFQLQGLKAAALFALVFVAWSRSYLTGFLSAIFGAALFAFIHDSATRVMFYPPLRESFGLPFLWLQMVLLVKGLNTEHANANANGAVVPHRTYGLMAATTVLFVLTWQFSSFVLLTQSLALAATYILGYTSAVSTRRILLYNALGLVTASAIQGGDQFSLLSFHSVFSITASAALSIPRMDLTWLRRSAAVAVACGAAAVTRSALQTLLKASQPLNYH